MMFLLFGSLVLSRKVEGPAMDKKLKSFRLPDFFIWIFIGSLAGTFLIKDGSVQNLVSMNFLAVSVAAYFFQGLAVFHYFLNRFQINGFWRVLAYFLAVFQFFLFLCGLGVLDYWSDFRSAGFKKLEKKSL